MTTCTRDPFERASRWTSLGLVVALAGCPQADPPSDETTGDASSGTAPENTGDASSGIEPEDTGDTTGEPFVPEETHVVLMEDCGLPLACDPISVHIDAYPPEAVECARALHADGETGLVLAQYIPGGGPNYDPNFESAFFLMADRRVLRQTRGRYCPEPPCESPPWGAWRAHELCEIDGSFHPDGALRCLEVDDFTCEELLELSAQPPVPTVPCAQRTTEDDCDQVLSSEASCRWRDQGATYPADSCEALDGPGVCRELNFEIEECTLPPVCAGIDGETVLFRNNDDGTTEITTAFGCWVPQGFERCAWDSPGVEGMPGVLVNGPPACNCPCG